MSAGNFQTLDQMFPQINSHSPQNPAEAFAIDEFRRSPLLENYFWLLYIFDGNDAVARGVRFNEYLTGFKRSI